MKDNKPVIRLPKKDSIEEKESKNSKGLQDYLDAGSKSPTAEPEPKKKPIFKEILLKLQKPLIDRIDRSRRDETGEETYNKQTRTAWIRQAIEERLEREA